MLMDYRIFLDISAGSVGFHGRSSCDFVALFTIGITWWKKLQNIKNLIRGTFTNILAETLVLAGTAGDMAPPAEPYTSQY